jgi:hypothetical protein
VSNCHPNPWKRQPARLARLSTLQVLAYLTHTTGSIASTVSVDLAHPLRPADNCNYSLPSNLLSILHCIFRHPTHGTLDSTEAASLHIQTPGASLPITHYPSTTAIRHATYDLQPSADGIDCHFLRQSGHGRLLLASTFGDHGTTRLVEIANSSHPHSATAWPCISAVAAAAALQGYLDLASRFAAFDSIAGS